LAQTTFPMALRQRSLSAMRARKYIQLCLITMARRRLKYPNLSILSCYRARRGISQPFLAQHPFPLAFQQMRVQAMRARRPIQLCLSTMARRRLKYPSVIDFVVLSCAPRDFFAIFGTTSISLGDPTEEGLVWTTETQRISIIVSWLCGDVVSRKKL
jgi:hypothetical protein